MSSFSSTSSIRSVMTDREAKKLEKILAQEAQADRKAIDHAMKDVKAAEKALKKCAKTTAKAQKEALKQKEKEHSAAKAHNKATHQHADTLEKETQAYDKLSNKRQHETEADQATRQMHSNLDDCQHTAEANAMDREQRLAQIQAQFAQGTASNLEAPAERL